MNRMNVSYSESAMLRSVFDFRYLVSGHYIRKPVKIIQNQQYAAIFIHFQTLIKTAV